VLSLARGMHTFCNSRYVARLACRMKAWRSSLCCSVEGLRTQDTRSSSIILEALALSSVAVSCSDAQSNAYCRSAVGQSVKTQSTLTNFDLAIACRDRDVFYIDRRQVKACGAESTNSRKCLIYCYDGNGCTSDSPTSVLIVLTSASPSCRE
jgi:hypothetical protein